MAFGSGISAWLNQPNEKQTKPISTSELKWLIKLGQDPDMQSRVPEEWECECEMHVWDLRVSCMFEKKDFGQKLWEWAQPRDAEMLEDKNFFGEIVRTGCRHLADPKF